MYVLVVVDFASIVSMVFTLYLWNSSLYDIPTMYLFLYLFNIMHVLLAPGLFALLCDSINFYFINMIAIIAGVSTFFNFIAVVWRAVCFDNPGFGICPMIPLHGVWLIKTTIALEVILFFSASVSFVCLIFYIRAMKYVYNMRIQLQQQQAATIIQTIMPQNFLFRQDSDLFKARIQLRGLQFVDFLLFSIIVLLRIIFFYNIGFWYSPYFQVCHIFVWLWILELSGSVDQKNPLSHGGSDASKSDTLAFVTFNIFIYIIIADFANMILMMVDLFSSFLSFTIVEVIVGWILLGMYVGLVFYDALAIFSLSNLTTALSRKQPRPDSQQNRFFTPTSATLDISKSK